MSMLRHGRHRLAQMLAYAALVAMSACSTATPDLARLYRDSAQHDTPPLIVVPGMLGSRLRSRDSGREIWPGSVFHALMGDRSRLALDIDPYTLEPIDDNVDAHALFDGLLGVDFYGQLQKTLEQAGGYRPTAPGTPIQGPGRRYYVMPYDWRQDNVRTAAQLDALIEQIRRDHGNPKLRVDVVAHSMGGLILRYYLRYGTRDVLDDNRLEVDYAGLSKVRTAVLLGTPNLGSVSALHGFIEGARVGWNRVPPEVAATMPSTYQLFPHPLYDWLVTVDGRPLDRDVYDPRIWRAFGWSIFDPGVRERYVALYPNVGNLRATTMDRYFDKRLQRARRFVWALTRDVKDAPEQLIVFGGNCAPTPARLAVEEIKGESMVRLWPRQIRAAQYRAGAERLMIEPGDGMVTKASLLGRITLDPTQPRHRYADFPLASSLFLCESHSQLTANPSFQDNLLDLLLSHDRRFDQPRPEAHPRVRALND